ncbi:MAG TPA: M48 family metallopeptidase [Kiritimatiellia bacterium]
MIAPAIDSLSDDNRAREYEAVHHRLFALRALLTMLAALVFLVSGVSARLAEGLGDGFGMPWPVANAVYLVTALFGATALLFPLTWYSDFVNEHRFGLSRQGFGDWFRDYLKSLVLELFLGTAFFYVLYAVLHWTTAWWWLGATLFYVSFAVVLTAVAPVLILPMFHNLEPLDRQDLTKAVKEFIEREGLKVVGVFSWGLSETTGAANAALAGLGRTRRIILSDTMLEGYTHDEILAVLAHEVGHYRNRDLLRMLALGSAMAGASFYVVQVGASWILRETGMPGLASLTSFPLLALGLMTASLVAMPFFNTFSRAREYAADAYAVRSMGSAAPLVLALEKLSRQNLASRSPSPLVEFLLYSHPSLDRRVRHAKMVEGMIK